MGDEVQEVDSVLVESQDVLGPLHRVRVSSHGEETGTKELPLAQDLEGEGLIKSSLLI